MNGGLLADTSVRTFDDIEQARSWLGDGRAIWSYHGNGGMMERLRAASIRPVVWSHIDLSSEISDWLDKNWIEGVITVSDFCRIALLHHSRHRRIGRIYNPLNPFYAGDAGAAPDQVSKNRTAVFSGYVGETKGAHHLFQCWPHVKRALPDAELVVAGSAKLYHGDALTGPYGVATDEFEKRYIVPLQQEFGSLEQAGVQLAGMLSPAELRSLYRKSSVGVVNLNAFNATETFSCSGVEMAASGLRVFSMATAALPETLGFTENAILVTQPDELVPAFVDALGQPRDSTRIGVQQRQMRERYALSHILDQWEALLVASPDHFYGMAGPWQYRKNLRYLIKKTVAKIHAGALLDKVLMLRARVNKHIRASMRNPS